MYYPTLEEVKEHKNDGNLIPVYREVIADMETPVSAFLKINRGGYSFLLESVEGGQQLARYSFIGTEPYRVLVTRGEIVHELAHIHAGHTEQGFSTEEIEEEADQIAKSWGFEREIQALRDHEEQRRKEIIRIK